MLSNSMIEFACGISAPAIIGAAIVAVLAIIV